MLYNKDSLQVYSEVKVEKELICRQGFFSKELLFQPL